jgi:hypothetical protein
MLSWHRAGYSHRRCDSGEFIGGNGKRGPGPTAVRLGIAGVLLPLLMACSAVPSTNPSHSGSKRPQIPPERPVLYFDSETDRDEKLPVIKGVFRDGHDSDSWSDDCSAAGLAMGCRSRFSQTTAAAAAPCATSPLTWAVRSRPPSRPWARSGRASGRGPTLADARPRRTSSRGRDPPAGGCGRGPRASISPVA